MVVAAIISLQDPVGSHPDDIMHWIQVPASCLSLYLGAGHCIFGEAGIFIFFLWHACITQGKVSAGKSRIALLCVLSCHSCFVVS